MNKITTKTTKSNGDLKTGDIVEITLDQLKPSEVSYYIVARVNELEYNLINLVYGSRCLTRNQKSLSQLTDSLRKTHKAFRVMPTGTTLTLVVE